jgi:hypothetical protein
MKMKRHFIAALKRMAQASPPKPQPKKPGN